MGMRRVFALGLLAGVALTACAGAKFSYRWYGLSAERYEGTLLGPKPENDLHFSVCEPDPEPSPGASPVATKRGKCVVVLADEFARLRTDYLDLEQRLITCENGH